MKTITILLALICYAFVLRAQPGLSSSGRIEIVVSSPQQQLSFVTVELVTSRDSARVAVTTTDSTGKAFFTSIPAGFYLLRLTRVNFTGRIIELNHNPQGESAATIRVTLLPLEKAMQEVVVSGKKNYVRQLADKTVINVDAAINNTGTTALEVLERSPGVTVDKDGNISLKGRPNVMVMIDNKPSYVSGGELATLLGGMSSNQIESIELIDNPSAKYDAAGNAGIINIITKKNRQRGFNGNASLSYGQGRYYKNNNSLGLNYREGAFNFFLNYSMNLNRNYLDMYALRKYYKDDGRLESQMEQPTYMRFKGQNHTIRTGVDYFAGKKTTIGLALVGTNLNRTSEGEGDALWMDASGLPDSSISTESANKTHWQNAGLNLNLRHAFNATSELTVDLDLLGYRIAGSQAFSNQVDSNNSEIETFVGDLPSNINILSAKADYSTSIGNDLKLETGIKTSGISTDNEASYFIMKDDKWEPDPGKTNHFLYRENIHAVYGSLHKKLDKWTFQSGLRYEYTRYEAEQRGYNGRKDSTFSRNYSSLFPSALIGLQADSSHQFNLSIGRRIDRPPFQKLNPFVFIINKYTYQRGNPFILPQYTWNIELSHIFKEVLTTSISYNITNDYFSQIFYSDTSGMVIYTEGNLGKMKNLGITVSGQFSPANWWTASAEVTLNHKNMEGFVWTKQKATITQMNMNINNQFRFKRGWAAELSGYYITKSQTDIQEIVEPTGQVSLGLSKQVLKNKGSIKLSFRDIFYTQAMAGNTQFLDATEYFKLTRDSRVVSITFAYRFGKPLKTPGKRNSGGAGDEIERVGTGG
ncbi:outer membrane beta-barrel family protein [Flavihumibacter solisilvae]|uniref:outer membrane beta-barrel family protein n=1 Tax=Flavihumibacter solisilvae TaxID=1349421 RepID=UPI001364C30A|nr:outer membrane beta-barrel family protein [Flavihumibacter solisilvae]